eukprot:m.18715 g.18715  ORF g.18715 m.18715 type:complete len:682 (+) comp8351_c0_seq4:46-2091(+)
MVWKELSVCCIGGEGRKGETLATSQAQPLLKSQTAADCVVEDNDNLSMSWDRCSATMLHRFHLVNRRLIASEVIAKRICSSLEDTVQFVNDALPDDVPRVHFPVSECTTLLDVVFNDNGEQQVGQSGEFKAPQLVYLRRLVSKVPKVRPTTYDIVLSSSFTQTQKIDSESERTNSHSDFYISLPLHDITNSPCFKVVASGELSQKSSRNVTLYLWVFDSNFVLPTTVFSHSNSINQQQIEIEEDEPPPKTSKQAQETLPPNVVWLKEKMFPKLIEWYTSSSTSALAQWRCSNEERKFTMTNFAEKYQQIKDRYAHNLIKNWPESTDPLKFVYEELAIAAYLCLVFESTPPSCDTFTRKFLDLGCGNGLLTYVLTHEGYNGYGVDVRSRKIWKWFGTDVDLREHTVTPNTGEKYEDCEWLIGNHSDELTPWLPIMCTRTSPHQRMWVLPCCPFELGGHKHKTRPMFSSQYDSYLHHIKDICTDCGLAVVSDVLRIPSTKRICFTGVRQSKSIETKYDEVAQAYLEEGQTFKKRAKVQVLRNCTRLPRSFLDECVTVIAMKLLECGDDKAENCTHSVNGWRIGGELLLADVAKLLGKQRLKTLKSECGGVKTLMKNHRQIFQVSKNGVRLRRWDLEVQTTRPKNIKERPCWFFNNHPDGCPKPAHLCPFLHGEDDAPENFTAE